MTVHCITDKLLDLYTLHFIYISNYLDKYKITPYDYTYPIAFTLGSEVIS